MSKGQEGPSASREGVLAGALPVGETAEFTHCLALDPLPRLVGEARRFVAGHAPPLPDDTREVLLLLTSELVTNAVLHARTRIEVAVTASASCVLVTVHDLDLARPEQQPYDAREGGWGLGLVSALAEASALQTHPGGGKTAWFRLSRGAAAWAGDNVAARPDDDVTGRHT